MAVTTGGNWAYAVPLDETNGYAQPPQQPQPQPQPQRQPQQESRHVPPRSISAQRKAIDWDIRSDSGAVESRRISIRQSNLSSTGRKRSRNTLRDRANQQSVAIGPVDDSAWIHRDKLAQIEIQEMAEAGFHVRQSRRSISAGRGASDRSSRSQSRSRAGRPKSQERERERERSGTLPTATTPPPLEDPQQQHYASFDDFVHKKRVSTIPAAEEDERGFDPTVDGEIRTPEEVAATSDDHTYRQHSLRPSTSRIPISKASAVPVPQDVVDRDSPLPRSRSGSGALSGSWDEMQYARRARSNSIASQVLLDELEGKTTPPLGARESPTKENHSPPKSRVPTKNTQASGVRKASNGNGHGVKKSGSISQRPGSSKDHKPRPSSSHMTAPEGDPPWITNMYKPDPRLPPDQQMLPTHAKRMMQEQWEKEGKTGTAYDREFRLLNDEEIPRPLPKGPSSPLNLHGQLTFELEAPGSTDQDRLGPKTSGDKPASPLWPPTPKSDTSRRPSTGGGYKITPTISEQPPAASMQRRTPSPVKVQPPTRVPELDEKDEAKEKKGCCCVVM